MWRNRLECQSCESELKRENAPNVNLTPTKLPSGRWDRRWNSGGRSWAARKVMIDHDLLVRLGAEAEDEVKQLKARLAAPAGMSMMDIE